MHALDVVRQGNDSVSRRLVVADLPENSTPNRQFPLISCEGQGEPALPQFRMQFFNSWIVGYSEVSFESEAYWVPTNGRRNHRRRQNIGCHFLVFVNSLA